MTREPPKAVLCPACQQQEAQRHCPDGHCLWFVCSCGTIVEGVWVKKGLTVRLVVKKRAKW